MWLLSTDGNGGGEVWEAWVKWAGAEWCPVAINLIEQLELIEPVSETSADDDL